MQPHHEGNELPTDPPTYISPGSKYRFTTKYNVSDYDDASVFHCLQKIRNVEYFQDEGEIVFKCTVGRNKIIFWNIIVILIIKNTVLLQVYCVHTFSPYSFVILT